MTAARRALRPALAAAWCALAFTWAAAAEAQPAPKPELPGKPDHKATPEARPPSEKPKTEAKPQEQKPKAEAFREQKPAVDAVRAGETGAAGPRAGSGSRSVEPAPPRTEKVEATTAAKAGESASTAKVSAGSPKTPPAAAKPPAAAGRPAHQRGRPPRTPSATLPAGAPRANPDLARRREVAGGPTADDVRAGTDDPELRALREADRALFPKPLLGAQPGWSWDLPRPVERSGPEIVASGTPPAARIGAAPEPPATSPQTAEWLRTLTLPNLPVRLDARVVKYLEFYRDSARGRAIARVWAKKSGRYLTALRVELAKAGLPTDLVWLSLIESSHNPSIVSPAGAVGLWQFMADSGRLYGLTVDRWVDERLDPQRSTEAAVRHLSDLYRRFGSWELAMAAYNMGYAGLTRAIRKFNTNDFWELCNYEAGIPWETTLYVPKIFATAIVMNNRKAFGLSDVVPDAPVSFDTVLISPAVPLEKVAAAADTSVSTIAQLNRHYLAGRTPPARPGDRPVSHAVRVPSGKGTQVSQKLAHSSDVDPNLEAYILRFGDTVASVAAARKISEVRLRQLNRIASGEALSEGAVLLVPRKNAKALSDPSGAELTPAELPPAAQSPSEPGEGEEVVVVPPRQFSYPDRERVFYRVVSGDTLGAIAKAFGVARTELVAWNSIDESARLHGGMVLQVFVKKDRSLSHVRHIRDGETRVLVAGTADFFDYFEGLRGRKRIKVVARPGDSLRTIGARYGMSIGWMERINRRSRSDKLEPGDTVIVYADRRVPDARLDESALAATPLPEVQAPRPDALPAPNEEGAPGKGTTAGP